MKFDNSIRFKFLSVIAVILFISTVITSTIIAINEKKMLKHSLVTKGRGLASYIDKLSVDPLITKDYLELDSIVCEANKDEEIVYTIILDVQGNFLTSQYASINYRSSRVRAILSGLSKDSELQDIIAALKKTEAVTEVTTPILVGTNIVGRVAVGMSEYRIRNQIVKTVMFVLILNFAAALTLGVVLFVASKKMIFTPITELAKAVTRLAKDVTKGRLDIKTTGEVKVLIDSFNQMAEDLNNTTVSKEYMNNIIRSMNDILIVILPDGSIRMMNEAACKLLGYSETELAGQSIERVLPDESAAGVPEFKDLVNKGTVQNIEKTCLTKDGRKIPVLFSSSVMCDANNDFQALVCVAQDITIRKQAEKRFAKLNECLLSFGADSIKNINLLVALCGEQLEATCAIYNRLEEGMLCAMGRWNTPPDFIPEDKPEGHICYDVIRSSEDDVCVIKNLPQTVYAQTDQNVVRYGLKTYVGKAVSFGGHFVGSVCVVYQDDRLLSDDDKKYLGIIASAIGVEEERRNAQEKLVEALEEHKKLEAQLRHAQKMEAVGQLAGGVAHDFNNILTAIIGYGNFLLMKMDEDDQLKKYVKQMLAAAGRAAGLTQRLLAFSRTQMINLRPVSLNEVIDRVEKLLVRVIGEDMELRTIFADEQLTVMADTGQIEQVLMNLATNARDAMPRGGLLTIETQHMELDSEFLKAHGYGKPGMYGLISVTDTGAGMNAKTVDRIFEPFFTTKEVGKGTGLGLAIVYGIIKQHNGYINVYSEPGAGTTFRIYLPLTKEEIEKTNIADDAVPSHGTETVLLAEDETEVREVTRIVLEEAGYNVIEAADGEDTVNKFVENRDKISILLLDVIMPKKNGKESYDEIKTIRPDIKVLFTSGYTADIIDRNGQYEGLNFIPKPASPAELLKKIREALDS